ncbi:MAG: hypothetical protein M3N35_13645 [Candidatus Binatota bacterium]|nr:hypothetical protein [Candidatus Binatota bacterium]
MTRSFVYSFIGKNRLAAIFDTLANLLWTQLISIGRLELKVGCVKRMMSFNDTVTGRDSLDETRDRCNFTHYLVNFAPNLKNA